MDRRQVEMCRRITVAAIMRNEEARVGEFLDSLPCGLPAIIYDDMSTDRTAEIARGRGATVIGGSATAAGFADKRNAVLRHVKSEWALHLDADEICPAETLLAAVEAILADPAVAGLSFPVHGFFLGRRMRGRAWKLRGLRLARVARSRWDGAIHEKLVCDGLVRAVDAPVVHYGDDDYLRRARKSLEYNILEIGRIDREMRFAAVCLRPFWEFFKYYVVNYGWIDGKPGVIFAFHVWAAWFQRLAMAYTRTGHQEQR